MATPNLFLSVLMLSVILLVIPTSCKKCTNSQTELSSHTLRYHLLYSSTINESSYSSYFPLIKKPSVRVGFSLYRRSSSRRRALYQKDKEEKVLELKPFSLHKVRLDEDSDYGRAQKTNLEYLLSLDVDRLGWSFRKTAGVYAYGEPYGGWESKDCELRGHFVGHYLSATALMWASTHDESLWNKMNSVIDALYECQQKLDSGYLSAFPSELFDRFEAVKPVWAPYYTIHKIMAGLLDQYTLAGNKKALEMVKWMATYFYNRVQNVIRKYTIERHWTSLNEETGGMNDILYSLYTLTGDQRHLELAQLFDKPCFLGLLAMKADSLSNFHANTHIPIVIGSEKGYEVTQDSLLKEISVFFMETINSSHAYITGGTSAGEFWTDPKRLGSTLGTENQESCTSYNMLKVARNLFLWTKSEVYAGYFERSLINGVLSIQRGTEPGVMIYMLPLGRGKSKSRSYHGWGTPEKSFWCCYGTGIESFSKLGESIYFQVNGASRSLYVTQFIPSTLTWDAAKLIVKLKVLPLHSWDPYLQITLEFFSLEVDGARSLLQSTVNIRMPSWTSASNSRGMLNDENIFLPEPGNFLRITRTWEPGDKLNMVLPVRLQTEPIKDDRPEYASVMGILFGPYVLAGMSTGDWDLSVDNLELSNWITPVPEYFSSQLITLYHMREDNPMSEDWVLVHDGNMVYLGPGPKEGTDEAARATFRVRVINQTSEEEKRHDMDLVGRLVSLEAFDQPDLLVAHTDEDKKTVFMKGSSSPNELNTVFLVHQGLDGRNDTISFESLSARGCFLWAPRIEDPEVKMHCHNATALVDGASSSFVARKGVSQYDALSFIAKGAERSYLLSPIMGYKDESYTVFFNVTYSGLDQVANA
ncbi:uncharacterized protein LOC18431721 [Amborella trichopoda]|uniref:Alpha-L-arabinofuranosidase B arabinose-binding domain-containing protein n=1 Tax=Amborella trichopoda TaxID=13333 RepID=W1P154_AMBTC|nr:uncharacterized protein LOC18431721 [Amborella trichopoda]ERN03577.1 hypothetical protein AMTR_s00042p00117600 [Amborella trichopoda]|eukprot:XP_006841902.1 uncharacterized protein LOC18431721 [Amborella trichopoda]